MKCRRDEKDEEREKNKEKYLRCHDRTSVERMLCLTSARHAASKIFLRCWRSTGLRFLACATENTAATTLLFTDSQTKRRSRSRSRRPRCAVSCNSWSVGQPVGIAAIIGSLNR